MNLSLTSASTSKRIAPHFHEAAIYIKSNSESRALPGSNGCPGIAAVWRHYGKVSVEIFGATSLAGGWPATAEDDIDYYNAGRSRLLTANRSSFTR